MSSAQNDTIAAADAALARAASFAGPYYLTAKDFLGSVHRVRRVTQVYHRALFALYRRTAVVCYGAADTNDAPVNPPDPANIDPWSSDPEHIAAASRVVISCTSCAGRGAVPCPDLQRKKHENCSDCSGTGQVAGVRGDKKCVRCRGTGTLGCRICQAGLVPCLLCTGKGRHAAWIEVRTEKLLRVVAENRHPLARTHARLEQPEDFEQGPWPYPKLADERCAGLPADCPSALRPQIDERTERLVASRVQVFGQGRIRVHYGTALGEGVLLFDERGNGPLPGSDLRPLSFRKRLIQAIAGCGLLFAMFQAWRYSAQHEWFWEYGHGGWILLLGILSALCAAVATYYGSLTKAARSSRQLLAPSVVTGILCSLTALVSNFDRPSGARAESALLQGDLRRARLEAEALQAVQRDLDSSAAVLDKLHQHDLRTADDFEKQLRVTEVRWFSPGLHDRVVEEVRKSGSEELDRAIQSHDIEKLKRLEKLTDGRFPALHLRANQQLAIALGQQCLRAQDAECVFREAKHAEELGVSGESTAVMKQAAGALLHDEFAASMRTVHASKRPQDARVALDAAMKAAQRIGSLIGESTQPSVDELSAKLKRVNAHIERSEARQRHR